MIINIISSYSIDKLIQQAPSVQGINFVLNSSNPSDVTFLLNHSIQNIFVKTRSENIFLLHQEPNKLGVYNSKYLKENNIKKVFTHTPTKGSGSENISSHPGLPWGLDMSYGEVISCTPFKYKRDAAIMIASNKCYFSGHVARLKLRDYIINNSCNVHLYGRGFKEFEKKEKILSNFKYSIEIENINKPDYWTEKLSDCFLMNTLPIYQGCPNITKYFPKEAFIDANGCTSKEIIALVATAIKNGEWERRQDALAEAKDLVLKRYSLFPTLINICETYAKDSPLTTNRIYIYRKTKIEKLTLSSLKRSRGRLPMLEKLI